MNYRAAEEAQLLAEEKWIIDALKQIRNQRNCLQIERLHLESLKANLTRPKSNNNTKKQGNNEIEAQVPSTSSSNLTNDNQMGNKIISNEENSGNSINFGVPVIESKCNDEQLNLAVTKPVFSQDFTSDMNIEEYDDDEDTCENIVIEINMLMNSNQS